MGLRRSQTADRERNAENGRYLEQVRTDRGAQTRQAGPRDAAEKHHHRQPRPCGDRAPGRDRRPHIDSSKVPLDHFSTPETKAIMAKQAADIGDRIRNSYRRPLSRDLDDMGVDVQLICPARHELYYAIPIDAAVKATAGAQRRHRRIYRQAHRPALRRSAACR